MLISPTGWSSRKVNEIIAPLVLRQPRLVGDGRQQDRVRGVILDHFIGFAGLQRSIPAVEQAADVGLRYRFARHRRVGEGGQGSDGQSECGKICFIMASRA
jgi:hypothetical protein